MKGRSAAWGREKGKSNEAALTGRAVGWSRVARLKPRRTCG